MSYDDSSSRYATEIVYGTEQESRGAMSEKVQTMASTIYKELQQMISKYDHDVVKTLMPMLVSVLENLDSAYLKNQEQEVELELLREDNEQLVTQYEREKSSRKISEQKLLELEDAFEGEKREMASRQESLESIVRMLQLKLKNSLDHMSRLEERENELKMEYTKVHERYTELLKTHMDYMERTKILLNTAADRVEVRGRLGLTPVGRSSGPLSFGFASLENSVHIVDQSESVCGSPVSESPPSEHIGAELAAADHQQRDGEDMTMQATSPASASVGRSHTKSEKRVGNSLYQELAFNENDNMNEDDSGEVTGGRVHPGEYASSVNDNYFGMGKEVEKLIMENSELLTTKNALNVVKNDLIVKVDELTTEQEVLKTDISNMTAAKEAMQDKIRQLESEIKTLKETLQSQSGTEGEEEADVPMAQRKRFTRVEMARVLMERNQYKERFMELQEAVRLTQLVRASRVDTAMEKKKSIWDYFSNLFIPNERPQRPLSTPHLRTVTSPQPGMRHSRTQANIVESQLIDHHPRRTQDRKDQYRQVRAHMRKDDGRTQAYGWSLPGKSGKGKPATPALPPVGVPVPVPVFCRPISESGPKMTLSCAAGVNMSGGVSPNGRHDTSRVVGDSVFYTTTCLAEELKAAQSGDEETVEPPAPPKQQLSSEVWICSTTDNESLVMILDANAAGDVKESFAIDDKHIMCITSVPGATPDDYEEIEQLLATDVQDYLEPTTQVTEVPSEGSKDAEEPPRVVGTRKLMKTTLLPTSSSTEVDPDPPAEDHMSPPLNSTPDTRESRPAVVHPEKVVEPGDLLAATMWMGTKNGFLYVHSALDDHSKCLAKVKLNDAILSIVSCGSRCVVALADGSVAVFGRKQSGHWDLSRYWSLTVGEIKSSVRCLCSVITSVWCGYRNKIRIVDPKTLQVVHTLDVHPRQESQVRQMAAHGDGVWLSIKMDSNLSLYHARTCQHLTDVDIEPYVSKMLGAGKLGFSFVRITSLLISAGRLWIGTSNGVIISIPLMTELNSRDSATALSVASPGPVGSIPWCCMAHAQLSFHGHKDAVTFFVGVPGAAPASSPPGALPPPILVMSGGEGYIDFRSAESEMEDSVREADDGTASAPDTASKSHIIVWQVSAA